MFSNRHCPAISARETITMKKAKNKKLSPKLSVVKAKTSVTLVQALALQGGEDALDNALSIRQYLLTSSGCLQPSAVASHIPVGTSPTEYSIFFILAPFLIYFNS
jgi:hypothetical protein